MADKTPALVDAYGRPLRRDVLTQEVAGPTLTGVRSPLTGYPGDGLTPGRIAAILRAADQGDPLRYLELAETVEERDMHYAGVLGTRRRSVAQLDITVEAASDAAEHVAQADMVREWLKRDELQEELFDMLDAIGKGFSVTEIIWDTSEGDWRPDRLEYRDPRFFTFDKRDLKTPLLRTDTGDEPLAAFKFVTAAIKAKSGISIRSGIARLAVWFWMFKAFTNRDWAIFSQTFGQPVRVGKYGTGASEKDKDVLFAAVANIAGDCAAIIPDTMLLEFVESKNVGQGAELYEKRAEWLDRQLSKAVLGQTATTDAIAGGHAVGKIHRNVQEDIERSDAKALAAVLNRDLVRPWIVLQYGPQKKYPKLKIGREETVDLQLLVDAVEKLVPYGLRVEKSVMADKLGLPDAPPEAEILAPPAPPPVAAAVDPKTGKPLPPGAAPPPKPEPKTALQAVQPRAAADAIDDLVAVMADQGFELVGPLIVGLQSRLAAATSEAEAAQILAEQLVTMDVGQLAEAIARASFAARLAGETGQPLS